MSEAHAPNGEPLDVRRALREITRLEGLEIGLYQRTEGITWMFWALVTSAIYLSYFAAGATYEDAFPTWAQFLWAPWVALGVAATMAVWHSAHVGARVELPARRSLAIMAVYCVVYLAIIGVAFLAFDRDDPLELRPAGIVLMALSVASMAAAFVRRSSAASRGVAVVVGSLGLLAALVLAVGVSYDSEAQTHVVQTLTGIAVLGGGWFLGGAWLTLKG